MSMRPAVAWGALSLLLAGWCPSSAGAVPALEAGGIEALPSRRVQPVPLANAGFEEGAAGWRRAAQGPFALADSGAHGGKACLRFDAGVPSKFTPSVSQSLTDMRPGIHVLRFWLKTRGLQPPQQGAGGVRVSIEYLLDSGERSWPSTKVFGGTADWQQVELSVLIPPGIKDKAAAISVHRYGSPRGGEAWFDDFSLERLREPAVEAFLRYPNYRGYLPDDGPQAVRLWVKVNEPKEGAAPQITVTDVASGRTVATASMAVGKAEEVVEIDARAWPLGRYAVQAALGDFRYPPYVIQKISAEQRRQLGVWFDERSVLHLDGKAVFPIGFYNTVRQFAVVDDAEVARLDEMAEAPTSLNINYTWWPCSVNDRRRYLAEMHKRGIWYLDTLMPFRPGEANLGPGKFPICDELLPDAGGRLDTQEKCDRFLTLLAQAMRTLPGHAGWYVMDERPFGLVPAIFHQYSILRKADPDHPTYGVSDKPSELPQWRDALDVFGLDPYPLFNMKAGRPLTLAGDWTRAGMDAVQGSRPVWMVMQFFQGWSADRWPTEEELRTMSLMAVAEGARGLFYWSFGIRALLWVKDPAERKEYWRRAVKVTRELKAIEPALTAPDAPALVASVSDPRIRWRAREASGKWHVFAYLPARKFAERSDAAPVQVTFTLKDGQAVSRSFRPDTADWFEASPRKP